MAQPRQLQFWQPKWNNRTGKLLLFLKGLLLTAPSQPTNLMTGKCSPYYYMCWFIAQINAIHTHTNINVLYLYQIFNFFCDATACSLSGLYVTIHEWVHPDCHRICRCFGPNAFWECWPADLWQVSFISIVKRIIESPCGYNTQILWQLWQL